MKPIDKLGYSGDPNNCAAIGVVMFEKKLFHLKKIIAHDDL